jgi:hypothetical protein
MRWDYKTTEQSKKKVRYWAKGWLQVVWANDNSKTSEFNEIFFAIHDDWSVNLVTIVVIDGVKWELIGVFFS